MIVMNKEIKKKLTEIEDNYNVKVLFAVESGSRAWGFASNDSDYDVRFVYIHNLNYYLSLDNKNDVIEHELNDIYDINGWDLDKALKLLYKGNPTLFEWLNSPIIYKESKEYYKLKELSNSYFSKATSIYHYLSTAKTTYKTYIYNKNSFKLKKYFYVIRPILAARYVLKNNCVPPVLFNDLIKEMLPNELLPMINDLVNKKKNVNESNLIKPISFLNEYIEKEFSDIEDELKSIKNDILSYDKLNEFFIKLVKDYDEI